MRLRYIKYKAKSFVRELLGKSSSPRLQLNAWLHPMKIHAQRVLEVGAGREPVSDKVSIWDVKGQYKVLDNGLEKSSPPDFALDLNTLIFDERSSWNSTVKKSNGVIEQIIKFAPQVIFCLEVMEYIYKPETVLRFMHDVLSPSGLLYISFHSIYPPHVPYKYDCLRYTKQGIIHLLKDAGFSKWEITLRRATKGKEDLKRFYQKEKMHAVDNDSIYEIGYLVKAYK